ncbi:actin-3-like [Acanthaster planci]|uniref:Actin-3-like n=1 Tax=Acanthaster planci TaxID=133434 RepID=A0A8B7Y1A0_ACAPL|nr:actin-3-like [Acanthaster planci]XP_022086940.1 actin-3-like [Acanthaster planci]
MNSGDTPPVVLDCGTLNCKAGLAEISKRVPDFVFRTSEPFMNCDLGEVPVPIRNGYIENWDSMEVLLEHIFKGKMKIDPTNHSVLLSEPDGNPHKCRKTSLEILFEGFKAPAVNLSNQGMLSLYSIGQATGLVIQSGHGLTNVMTARDGHRPTFGRVPLTYTGFKLTEYTQALIAASLREQHDIDIKTVDFKLAEKFKEEHGYLQMSQGDKPPQKMVMLDVGGKQYSIDAGEIGAKIGEALFDPSILGLSCFGLTKAIMESIELSDDEDWMDEFYLKKILLAGGNTMIRGLQERLTAEVDRVKFLSFMTVNVNAPPYRHFSNWVGGSIISLLPTFDPCWITRQEYEENGSNIFRQKCLPY